MSAGSRREASSSWAIARVLAVLCAGCGSTDPFPGTFAGAGTGSTGDADGADAMAQTATLSLTITTASGVEADGGTVAPYTVHLTGAFDGDPVGAVDCTLTGVFGSGPSLVMQGDQTCSVPLGGTATTLTLLTGQLNWDGTKIDGAWIWSFPSGRTRWTIAAPRR